MSRSILFVACLFGAAVLALMAGCGGGSKEPTATPAPSPTSDQPSHSPTPTPGYELPPLTPFSAALTERLHAIRDRVAAVRGLPVPDSIQEGIARPEDVLSTSIASLGDITEEERAESDAYLQALRMLKLIPEDYSLENWASDYSTGIAGFYSQYDKALVLIGEPDDEISMYDELVLAHEYTHALQDAAFDLTAFQESYTDHPDDEAGLTSYEEMTTCIIEGDAVLTEYLYMEDVYGPNWQSEIVYEYGDAPSADDGFPEFLSRAFGFAYNECYFFVAELYEEGGWQAVNDAFVQSPATTEQVLDTDKFRAHELGNGRLPDDLTRDILTSWTATEIGQFGAFDTLNYILTITGDYFSAYNAAIGWGGGWARIYTSPTRAYVLQLQVSFDSSEDFEEFVRALGEVLRDYDVDTGVLETDGVRRFEIAGEQRYYGALGTPNGEEAAEMILATDRINRDRASAHLR
jgi:hypothetical protein